MSGSRCIAALVAVTLAGIVPATAQLGTIFEDSPRPPADVPAPRSQALRPPPNYPPDRVPGVSYPDQGRGTYPATGRAPLVDRPSTGVESQPLTPLPGTEPTDDAQPSGQPQQSAQPQPGAQPQPAPLGQPPLLGPPSGQFQPRGMSQPANLSPQPANAAPQPGDEVVAEPPSQKVPNPTAVFSGLDKITGRTITFDVAINETVQFGALQVTPRACYTRPPTESPNTDGFVEVEEITLQGEVRRIFSGWMFASSPGLHAIEHPIYDVWLVDCKGGSPSVASGVATPQAANTNGAAATVPPSAEAVPVTRPLAKPKR